MVLPKLPSTSSWTQSPYFAQTMCNMFKDHNLVAKRHRNIVSYPGERREIFGIVFEEVSADYKWASRALTIWYKIQWVVAVPFVIFFPGMVHILSQVQLVSGYVTIRGVGRVYVCQVCDAVAAPEFLWGASMGQNAFLRGQKSKKHCPKWLILTIFFF